MWMNQVKLIDVRQASTREPMI